MTVSIGFGRVGSKFFTCSGLGWVGSQKNGPTDNSGHWAAERISCRDVTVGKLLVLAKKVMNSVVSVRPFVRLFLL